jgi:hypothetical protein
MPARAPTIPAGASRWCGLNPCLGHPLPRVVSAAGAPLGPFAGVGFIGAQAGSLVYASHRRRGGSATGAKMALAGREAADPRGCNKTDPEGVLTMSASAPRGAGGIECTLSRFAALAAI